MGIYNDVDEIITNQKVGLLDETQYTRAGGADSYLDIKDIFFVRKMQFVSRQFRQQQWWHRRHPIDVCNGVRAVIYLKSSSSALTFTGGEGTAQLPYELQ